MNSLGENSLQQKALKSLIKVCENFLGNHRDPNYKEMINEIMEYFEKLNINITIKIHTLICHLEKFKESCGKYSDEQGERFHQDLKKQAKQQWKEYGQWFSKILLGIDSRVRSICSQ